MNISLIFFTIEAIKFLNFADCSKSKSVHNLSLSTSEHTWTMNSWKNSNFTPNWTNFVCFSSVRTNTFIYNLCTNFFFLHFVKSVANFSFSLWEDFGKMLKGFCFNSINVFLTHNSVFCYFKSFIKFFVCIFANCSFNIFTNMIKFNFFFRFTNFFLDFFNKCNNFLNPFVSEHNCIKHVFFCYNVCTSFNHHNGIFCSRNSNVHCALFTFFNSWVNNIFAINFSNHNASCWSCKRNIRNCKSHRATNHCKWFWSKIWVNRKCCCNNSNIIKKSFWKKWTNWSIDKAAC